MAAARYAPTVTVATPAPSATRIAALDGLRGATIVLVVVGHAGNLLWPLDSINRVPLLRGFFGGGAVGVFFIVGGYIVTRGLLRELDRGTYDPVRFYLRRLVRLGVQVIPLAVAIVLIHFLDSTDPYTTRATTMSAANMVTYTTNLQATNDLLSTRADLGHMWYLSVQQQVYLVLPLILLVFGRRRAALGVALAELIVASAAWRFHVVATDGWIPATVSTATRADAVLLGSLVAVLVSYGVAKRYAAKALAVGVLALLVLMSILKELGPFAYLETWGLFYSGFAALTVLGIAQLDRASVVSRALSTPALVWLGRASLAVFIWHLPIFMLVERHTKAWTWQPRAITALFLLAVVSAVTHRYLDEPARRWLQTHLRPNAAQAEQATLSTKASS